MKTPLISLGLLQCRPSFRKVATTLLSGAALLSAGLAPVSQAAPVERISSVEKPSKNRLHILMMGPASGDARLAKMQARVDDLAWIYRAPVKGGAESALGEVDAWLAERAWDVIYLDFGHADLAASGDMSGKIKGLQAIAAKALATGAVCIWGTAPAPADGDGQDRRAVSYNDRLRQNLRNRGVLIHDGYALDRIPGGAAEREQAFVESLSRLALEAVTTRNGPYATIPVTEKRDPARLLKDDEKLADPMKLAEVPARTATIYRAEEGQWQFNLHSYIAYHGGKFWAIWSSGRVNEDSSSQLLRYATSVDGTIWSESGVLAPDPDGESGPWRWMASGLYVDDGKLVALGSLNQGFKGGKVWAEAQLVRFEWTGAQWKRARVVARDCVLYYPPIPVGGRDLVVWRNEYAHFATAFREPDSDTWEVTRIPGPFPEYRLSETSHYVDAEGVVHLIIRDQGASTYLYHALSYDAGATWTIPVKTNYPDAMSKNFADRLSNGWFYLISNPKSKGGSLRDPLVITFSQDGWSFAEPRALRKGAPALRYKGGAKGSHSFQYSHAIEHNGRLWVIYATNKEDIEVSSYAIEDFKLR